MTRSLNGLGEGASQLFRTLQTHVDDIRTLLQCGVCIRPLYEPFTLACGHTFCYSCLTSWFGGGRSNKTCPDCRAPVKTQPAPAYLIRTVVQMFTSRAELLDRGETTAEHIRHQREEAEKIERDRENTHPREGGLFKGTFNRTGHQAAMPIIDVEDGVVRCPRCSWELEDDAGCAQCGYRQDDRSDTDASDSIEDWTDSEENSEMTDYYDDVAADTFHYDPYWALQPIYDNLPLAVREQIETIRRQHGPRSNSADTARRGWSEDGLDEDDDEDAEMDSFIDDDDDDDHVRHDYYSESDMSTVVGGHDHTRHQPEVSHLDTDSVMSSDDGHSTDRTPSESSVLDEDEHDEDDDDDDDDEPVRVYVNGVRRRHGVTYNQVVVPSTPPRPSNRSRVSNATSNRSRPLISRSAYNGASARQDRASTAGSSANNAITLEDDSDEGPIGPSRRSRNRRGYRPEAN
ncbi:uncharacterized protein ACLA_046800 [Aspergillus clavatus NRRL 1]|uniref:RING finger domain protein n=1 Tax=Aspergillus clavatus (strain ATCC 1007 / CBS 513.65 / DSM 816 / NCTC 3887 / NRRL 1 / QM 1276 / 107) TaxID=344612 RepID=A1CH59_ASPCL|nr:RING finger domain protein [Aspergillus clavatus NRRL 1]EAW10214.1 RING finger domain protein [Aspergillus clavatus NRRL 1]